MKLLRIMLMGIIAAAAMATPHAARAWPTRPITFVVPFPAGGITDVSGRLAAKLLAARLGQPVIVENKPGAAGSVGAEAVARQSPDGYTILFGTAATHGISLALYKNVRYDPIADFVPVHGLAAAPMILVINPSRPFKSLHELIAYARANPGKLNFGSPGSGTVAHLAAELFQIATATKMTHIPYKGGAAALTDLVAGRLDLFFDFGPTVAPFVNSGQLVPLAVTAKTRLRLLPEVPTVWELGLSDVEMTAWSVVFAPARTPPEVVKTLADALASVVADPEMIAHQEQLGNVPLAGLRDAKLAEFVRSESIRWREVVRASGAKLD